MAVALRRGVVLTVVADWFGGGLVVLGAAVVRVRVRLGLRIRLRVGRALTSIPSGGGCHLVCKCEMHKLSSNYAACGIKLVWKVACLFPSVFASSACSSRKQQRQCSHHQTPCGTRHCFSWQVVAVVGGFLKRFLSFLRRTGHSGSWQESRGERKPRRKCKTAFSIKRL